MKNPHEGGEGELPERIFIGATKYQKERIALTGNGTFSVHRDSYSPETDAEYTRTPSQVEGEAVWQEALEAAAKACKRVGEPLAPLGLPRKVADHCADTVLALPPPRSKQ